MDCASSTSKQQKLFSEILSFVGRTSGLECRFVTAETAQIHQAMDQKFIELRASSLDDVLFRSDTDGREFIQVNFSTGTKLLLTDSLIGFKPVVSRGFESSRIPRVVTTPDIISIFEAIQDSLHSPSPDEHEIVVLKRVFEAVLSGGEAVGFNLATERSWAKRIPTHFGKLAS